MFAPRQGRKRSGLERGAALTGHTVEFFCHSCQSFLCVGSLWAVRRALSRDTGTDGPFPGSEWRWEWTDALCTRASYLVVACTWGRANAARAGKAICQCQS